MIGDGILLIYINIQVTPITNKVLRFMVSGANKNQAAAMAKPADAAFIPSIALIILFIFFN